MTRSIAPALLTVLVAATLGTATVAAPSPARAYEPCQFQVSVEGWAIDCVEVSTLAIGWKWQTAIRLDWPKGSAGSPAVAAKGIAAGVTAIAATDVDPGTPAWAQAVLTPLTAAAGQAAPATPRLVSVVIDRECQPLASALADAGAELAAGLALLVEAAGSEPPQQQPGGAREAALQRFVAVRREFARAAVAARACAAADRPGGAG